MKALIVDHGLIKFTQIPDIPMFPDLDDIFHRPECSKTMQRYCTELEEAKDTAVIFDDQDKAKQLIDEKYSANPFNAEIFPIPTGWTVIIRENFVTGRLRKYAVLSRSLTKWEMVRQEIAIWRFVYRASRRIVRRRLVFGLKWVS
jgi:hypothetical protein